MAKLSDHLNKAPQEACADTYEVRPINMASQVLNFVLKNNLATKMICHEISKLRIVWYSSPLSILYPYFFNRFRATSEQEILWKVP